MSLIDLGEPGRFEPGETPVLRGYRRLSTGQQRRAWVLTALVGLAGAVAGIAPPTEPDPQLHQVGRVRGPMTQVHGDVVISYSDSDADIVAYPLDGVSARWSVPADQPPSDIAVNGDLFVIPFVGLSFLESTINAHRELPPRILAVEARGGRPRWQVSGWPIDPLTGPIIAVGSGTVDHERLTGVRATDGKPLWDVPLPGTPLTPLSDEGVPVASDWLLVIEKSGAVRRLRLADGHAEPDGHVVPGAEGMFAWRDLLGVRRPAAQPTDGDEFLMYRIGQDKPLWQQKLAPNGLALSPCGAMLCSYDSAGLHRIDPLTGTVVATVAPDQNDPDELADSPWREWAGVTGLGDWELVDMYKGHVLVRLDPSYAKDKRAWLGVATHHGSVGSVRPLMPIGPRSNSCTIGPDWLFCDGSAVEDAVSVRLSELDRLIDRLAG